MRQSFTNAETLKIYLFSNPIPLANDKTSQRLIGIQIIATAAI